MTKKEFNGVFGGVNGPEYLGAPFPEDIYICINEGSFNPALRYKEYDVHFNENENIIYLDWTSQSWPDNDNIDDFVQEVQRCFKYIGFTGKVKINIWMRGKKYSEKYHKQVEFTI